MLLLLKILHKNESITNAVYCTHTVDLDTFKECEKKSHPVTMMQTNRNLFHFPTSTINKKPIFSLQASVRICFLSVRIVWAHFFLDRFVLVGSPGYCFKLFSLCWSISSCSRMRVSALPYELCEACESFVYLHMSSSRALTIGSSNTFFLASCHA